MKKIAFISDFFINDGVGGAELTTDAIMRAGVLKGFQVGSIHCSKFDNKVSEQNKNEFSNGFSMRISVRATMFFCESCSANFCANFLSVRFRLKKTIRA